MPFDLTKVAATITLAFLAVSLFFTVRDSGNLALYKDVPYSFYAMLLVVFVAIMLILSFMKILSERTRLKYWTYLKSGLFIHIVATFYVFSLIFLLWGDATDREKVLFALFGLAAFAFYIFFALDLRQIIKDLNVEIAFNKMYLSRHIVSLYSLFFLILFGISFTYGGNFEILGNLDFESYPVILFFVVFFLVAFATYLSVTHKGFEEIMKKNVWSELSYLSGFASFVIVYFIYTIMKSEVHSFPLRDMFFIGYFAVLLIEIYSTRTLGLRYIMKYKMVKKKDVVDILNLTARYFLRIDYLEKVWDEVVKKYATPENRLEYARFSPSNRTFYLDELDEKTRITASVAMLLEMHRSSKNLKKVKPSTGYSLDSLIKDIEGVLGEKILLLPDELRSNFDEGKYYPGLLERTINRLIKNIQTFVPLSEQKILFDKLARIDPLFKMTKFKGSEIEIPEYFSFSREGFVSYFKLYLNSIEELFPFRYNLLYEPVKEEISEKLINYGISAADLLDMVPTGFTKIDEVIDGGLHKLSSTLLISEETKVKNEILKNFTGQGIKDKDYIVHVSSKRPAQEICDEMIKDMGVLENTTVIDLYQDLHTTNKVTEIIENGCKMIIPLNATIFQHSVVKAIKSYPKKEHKRVVLDVYNDLLRNFDNEELFKTLEGQIDGFRKWNCTSIVNLDPNLINEERLEELKKNFDNVIKLTGKDRDAYIIIEKLYGGTPPKKVIPIFE